MKARGERNDKMADTLIKLPILYQEGRKGVAQAQVAEVVELRWNVTEL